MGLSGFGYLQIGNDQITNATSVSIEGESGAQFQKTLSGDTGFSDGIPEMDVSAENVVPKDATQMGRVVAAWLNQEDVTARVRIGNYIFSTEGRILSISGSTASGAANQFSYKFHGGPPTVQRVTGT